MQGSNTESFRKELNEQNPLFPSDLYRPHPLTGRGKTQSRDHVRKEDVSVRNNTSCETRIN